MANINIDRSNTDQFYRYKMPRLVAKVEGSGNGIKTVVANMPEIAKALDRPPSYPLKYFGYELGAQTMIDTKNERYIVNGSHEAGRLQEMLDGFIKKFVLCQNCNNPETTLSVNVKKNIIRQTCAACGHAGLCDMKNKLSSYVIKNPPVEVSKYGDSKSEGKGKKGKGKANGKEEKKEDSKNGNGKAPGGPPGSPSAEIDPGFDVPPPVNGDDDDDDDWGSDDLEPVATDDLSKKVKALIVDADAEKSEGERLDLFFEFVKKQKQENKLTHQIIRAEAERLELNEKSVLLMVNAIFDEHMYEQIPKYRNLFLAFTNENDRAQRFLIGGFEKIVGETHADVLMPKCMRILKEFYDQDILDEDVILEWFDKPSKRYQIVSKTVAEEIRKKVTPFINWLKEAEAESDEESDDEIPVVSSSNNNKAAGDSKKEGKSVAPGYGQNGSAKPYVNGAATKPADEDDEDDVDIDAI